MPLLQGTMSASWVAFMFVLACVALALGRATASGTGGSRTSSTSSDVLHQVKLGSGDPRAQELQRLRDAEEAKDGDAEAIEEAVDYEDDSKGSLAFQFRTSTVPRPCVFRFFQGLLFLLGHSFVFHYLCHFGVVGKTGDFFGYATPRLYFENMLTLHCEGGNENQYHAHVDAGISVDAQNKEDGETCIIKAARTGHTAIVEDALLVCYCEHRFVMYLGTR